MNLIPKNLSQLRRIALAVLLASFAILDTNTISAQELGRTITSPFGIARQTSASESGSDGDTFVDPETSEVGHIIRNPFGVANPEGVDTGIDIPDSGEEEVGGIITNPFGVPDPDGVDTDVFNEDVDNEYCISLPEDEEYDIEEVLKEIEAAEGITTDGDVTTKTPFPPKDAPKNTGEDPQSYILEAFTLSMGFDNPLISDGASIPKLYVFAGDSIYVSLKTPLGSTPLNYTTWEITADSSSPSSSGVEDLTSINMPPLGAQNYTFHVPNSSYGKYLLTVKGYKNGTLISRKIDIVVFSLEIGKAIRRGNPNSDWTNNRVLLYAPESYDMKLSLEKREGYCTGDCAFLPNPDNNATPLGKIINISPVTELNTYYIKGITESHHVNDIILKVKNQNGNTLLKRSFIVYSQFVDESFEKHLPGAECIQHKDWIEACLLCRNNTNCAVEHCNTRIHPLDPYCMHCAEYCARACLKVMKGGYQDDYKRWDIFQENNMWGYRLTSMEENHGWGLKAIDISFHLYGHFDWYVLIYDYGLFEEKYDKILEYFIYNNNKKLIGARAIEWGIDGPYYNHAFIIYGGYMNTKEGQITTPMLKVWDPMTCSTSDEGASTSFFDTNLDCIFVPSSSIPSLASTSE